MKRKKHPYYDSPKRLKSMETSETIVFWCGLIAIVVVIVWGWLNA